jgi:3-deoxy-7-phosphoheptulonate synthase
MPPITPPEPARPAPRDWQPDSWQLRPALQQPSYPDPSEVDRVVAELSALPPLVTSWEVEGLKGQLAEAQRGERFLLQGGDCAESFAECTAAAITSKLKILLQMSLVLVHGSRKRVIRVGRFAGQYAKPRSADLEERQGLALPSYRGETVNRLAFTAEDRVPRPELMLRGYERAALTLNFVRSLVDGGFADLHHPEYWDLGFVEHSPHGAEYQHMVESIGESLRFMESLAGGTAGDLRRVDFFTSHEALLLPYEQAQTRRVPHRPGWYNLSTHLPWIGMRTSDPAGAHVEYCRGIRNPIGIKVGPKTSPEMLREMLRVLDPEGEPGRITLVHRFGVDQVTRYLPALIEAVRLAGKPVLWCSDPMHGNTRDAFNGLKTRRFEDILGELEQAFDVHAEMGSYLGGVHFELTGEDVTECVGGARGLAEADLQRDYRSFVDPRLNYEQALEMAMLIARRMGRQRNGGRALVG